MVVVVVKMIEFADTGGSGAEGESIILGVTAVHDVTETVFLLQ